MVSLALSSKEKPPYGRQEAKFRKWSPGGDCEKSQSDFYSSVLRPMYYSCWGDSIIFQLLVQHIHYIMEVSIPIPYCVCLELVPSLSCWQASPCFIGSATSNSVHGKAKGFCGLVSTVTPSLQWHGPLDLRQVCMWYQMIDQAFS